MHPFLPEITEALRRLWQGRWIGLAVAWLAGAAGAIYVYTTPDRYEATARVYVDTQSVLQPLLSGLTVRPNVAEEVQLLSRTLISRPNLQKLVRMTDMDLAARTAEERERLIDELMRTLYIRSAGQTNLYVIGFVHPNPAQANRVVQALLSLFVESGLRGKGNDAEQAKRFIEEQIKAYEQRLAEAENRLKEFKLRNLDLTGESGFFGSLSAVADNLRQARLELQEAYKGRDAIRSQLSEEEARAPLTSSPDSAPALPTPELDTRINALNKNLDEMLLRYTDQHPDVINTRRIVKEVEAQRDEERRRLVEERRSKGMPVAPSPVYPQLKLALAEAEARVAGLQARVADYEKRHAAQLEQARTVPEREAELAQLNRDYGIQKRQYESLVARRETATMSGEVTAATGVADFRIIDPPRVSPNPVAPNRRFLVPLVLLASLGAGLAASYLYALVHPTFNNKRALQRIGQRPVLGAVALLQNSAVREDRRRRRLLFFGGLGGLAATYCAALAVVFLRGLLPF